MGGEAACEARLVAVVLDRTAAQRRGPDAEHERRIAIHDLLEENRFAPNDGSRGPYRLRLHRSEDRLVFEVEDGRGAVRSPAALRLLALRSTLRDYEAICDSYHRAIKTAPRARIEAIDMGRRAFHDEGAEILRRELAGKVEIDRTTARRLFTLVHALRVRL